MDFKSEASPPTQALVLIFDLGGFSKFFAQPDVHQYVPKYLNRIFNCIDICINGGNQYWVEGIGMNLHLYHLFIKNF